MWDGTHNNFRGALDSFILANGLKRKMVGGLPCLDAVGDPDLMRRIRQGAGIYMLHCLANGKRGVGMSTYFKSREAGHFKRPTNEMLKNDIRDYGRGSFEFHIIEPLDLRDIAKEEWGAILWEREKYWVKRLWKTPGGKKETYNMVLPCIHRYSSDGKVFPPMEFVMAEAKKAGIKRKEDYLKWARKRGFPTIPNETYKDTYVDAKHFLGTGFPPMEVVMAAAKKAGIKGLLEYKKWARKRGFPTDPKGTYKDKWVDWAHFLGKEGFPPMEVVMAAAKKAGIRSSGEYWKWAKRRGFPSNPHKIYESTWVNWAHFLGKEGFPPMEVVMAAVKKAGIRGLAEYKKWAKKRGFPSHPERNYKDTWAGVDHFLSKIGGVQRKKVFPPIEEVMAEIQRAGIKGKTEYQKLAKKCGFPSRPERFYKDTWVNWDHLFGRIGDTRIRKKFPPMEFVMAEAKKAGIKGSKEYQKWAKKCGFPFAPYNTYKDTWVNWWHFLGTEFPPMGEVMEALQRAGVKNWAAYKKIAKKRGWPTHPEDAYKNTWVGANHFFGKICGNRNKDFPPMEEVMEAVQRAGIKGSMEYQKVAKKRGWPTEPWRIYKDKWVNWDHLFGKKGFPPMVEVMEALQRAGVKNWVAYMKMAKKRGWPTYPKGVYKNKWVGANHFFGKDNSNS